MEDKKNKYGFTPLQKKVLLLIARYLGGQATPAERSLLERWHPDGEAMARQAAGVSHEVVNRGVRRVWHEVDGRISPHKHPSRRVAFFRTRVAAAVVAVLVVVGITVGGLATDGFGLLSSTSQTVEKQTYSTPVNRIALITLPDGSTVTLNGGSHIQIEPSRFNVSRREVWLSGEAFFEVAKNVQKPFIIHSGYLTTTVRGTSFNVKAYASLASLEVSVRSGKVEVACGALSPAVLTAGHSLSFNKGTRRAVVSRTDWHDAAAWMQGDIVLDGAGRDELALRMRQRYGVDMVFHGRALQGRAIDGVFNSSAGIGDVMSMLCTVYGVSYRRQGHVINVYNNNR